jgi:hypothetical protein
MRKDSIQSYLNALGWQLWLRGMSDKDTLAEIESHLLESVERGLRNGLSREDAEGQALERFGSVRVISSVFEKERIDLMQKILLAVGVISGLFIAYVDSRPTWDDTGITAGIILLVCGLIALLGCQRPWLLALAVGGWIPLYGLLVTHNYGSILALIIAFIGAYAGWAFRIGIRRVLHPA